MEREQNALAIIPTGGGKSLLYQLKALDLKGITIVVSPLIALMNEQVNELNERGINAIALNSNYSLPRQRQLLRGLGKSKVKLLYIAPERLQNPFFRAALISSKVEISMIVVDEAHCISQWGSGFRPDYSQIPAFISFLHQNQHQPRVLCLTATLATQARADIASAFNVKNDCIYVSNEILRSNLSLDFKKVEKEDEKEGLLRTFLEAHKPKKCIVYLYSKMLTKRYATLLSDAYKTGFYNADIDAEERDQIYSDFKNGEIEILFATTAFGMGINIPDIESIVHFHIPNSIEEYYQQVGRGWRRKKPIMTCNCLVLWSEKNFRERKRELLNQKYTSEDIKDAYRSLTGSAEISKVGQVVNKSKDTLLSGQEYNLQLLKHKLEKYGIIRTLGELNGSPRTILMKQPTLLWKDIQLSAEEGMDSFGYVSEVLGIDLWKIIEHLYEQDLNDNIKVLPAMQKDVFFEVLKLEIPEDIIITITREINDDIDYRITQIERLMELFKSEDTHKFLANTFN